MKNHSADLYPLSLNQSQLWYIEKMYPGTKVNIVRTVLKMSGKLNLILFENTLLGITQRHENLRACFKEIDGVGYQVFKKTVPTNFNFIDLSDSSQTDQKRKLDAILLEECGIPFNLALAPLFRFTLFKLGNESHLFLITIHHLIMDAWSIDLLAHEIGVIYEASLYKYERQHLPTLENRYSDYTIFQNNIFSGESLYKRLLFWQKMLDGASSPTPIQPFFSPSYRRTEECCSTMFRIPNELFQKLQIIAKENHTTLFVIISSALFILYSRYYLNEDIVFGIPFANRSHKSFQHIIGFFVNTLPVRVYLGSCHSFLEVLSLVRSKILGALLHQDMPFVRLVEELKPERNAHHNPFFQIVINHVDLSKPNFQSEHLTIQREFISNAASIFDLILSIVETENGCHLNFDYPAELIDKSKINQINGHLRQLLIKISEDQQIHPSSIDILTDEEKSFLIENGSNRTPSLESRSIAEVFYDITKAFPHHEAVVFEDTVFTYDEINKHSNLFAHFLLENYPIENEELIALCLDKCEYLPICFLAIIKLGTAYVPIDPHYPLDRIAYILKDTKAKILITNTHHLQKLRSIPGLQCSILAIDNLKILNQKSHLSQENIDRTITRNQLACVFYTSGTTGYPKGVLIEHKGITSLVKNGKIHITDSDSLIQLSNIAFDAASFEIWGALLNGAKLYLPKNLSTLEQLQNLLDKKKISVLWLTKSLFDQLFLYDSKLFRGVKALFVGGEALNKKLILKLVKSHNSPAQVFNGYGPTENSTFSTIYRVNPLDLEQLDSVPIGKPLPNRSTYVLDQNLSLLPIGVTGELYVGGEGLSRGYLNQTELTSVKFFPNPYQTEEEKKKRINSKLYRTGDLVRLLPDGNLVFIGRSDSQIKIRGFRIELREIERALETHPQIQQAIIIHKIEKEWETGYLIGYYLSKDQIDTQDLFSLLSSKLPDYMLPKALIPLKEIPLTPNGKLDVLALPKDHMPGLQYSNNQPKRGIEAKLLYIMADTLKISLQQLDIKKDFFSLGGNSIMAIRLVNRLSKILKKQISISLIFEARTLERILQHLLAHSKDEIVIPRLCVNPKKQLVSLAQERLLFIDEYEEGTNLYNIPLTFKILQPIKFDILEESLRAVIERHETLRTLIKKNSKGEYYLSILDEASAFESKNSLIKKILATKDNLKMIIDQHQSHIFDLYHEIPIKIALIQAFEQNENYLSLVVHHIAFDGWSVDILLKEWKFYYDLISNSSEKLKSSEDLPPLLVQYKDFALWQRKSLNQKRLRKLLHFWKTKLYSFEGLNLLTDYPRPALVSYKGDEIRFSLESNLSKDLRDLSEKLNVSLYTVLLSAFVLMLGTYSGQEDIVLGTLLADRELPQITNLIGFFVNTLPIRIKYTSRTALPAFIKRISKELARTYRFKDLPFEKLVGELGASIDTSRHPIFQVLFAFQCSELSSCSEWLERVEDTKFFKNAKFDITLLIEDKGSDIDGCINFSTSLFKEETIRGYIETYLVILEQFHQILERPFFLIEDLSYLSEGRREQICATWNATDCPLSNQLTIPQLFESQVEKTPHDIALQCNSICLSYSKLNEEANRLGNYLKSNFTLPPDSRIALFLQRDEKCIIGILGILKAGGAYVPIDTSYPDEKIAYLLQDANIKVILTSSEFIERLSLLRQHFLSDFFNLIAIDNIETHIPLQNLKTSIARNSLAYVLYTSGTTGKPKGVMIEHQAYIATVIGFKKKHFPREKKLTSYSMTNYVFDIFGLEFGLAFFTGGTIILGNKGLEKVNCQNIDWIQLTPSLCKLNLDRFTHTSRTKFIIGGEILEQSLLRDLLKTKRKEIINAYGPTETTIWSTTKICTNYQIGFERSNIGTPLPNEKAYILNKNLQPLPIGAPGELYLTGSGVARGYLNQSKLTREKFVKNRFQTQEEKKYKLNKKLYKTGDIARWLSQGELEFIGRRDSQVKIAGHRIELEEIKQTINQIENLEKCIVLARPLQIDDQELSLICYYVSTKPIPDDQFIQFLQTKLSPHMIPRTYIPLEQLPITANGKLDEKSLPIPVQENMTVKNSPSNNNLEEQIRKEWAKTLGISEYELNTHHNFFEIGGNSFLAIKLISNLKSQINKKLSIKDIFLHPTIHTLCLHILSHQSIETNQKTKIKNKTIQLIINRFKKYKYSQFSDFDPFIALNQNAPVSPLFLFPPGNGGLESYLNNIVKVLNKIPLILLENIPHYLFQKFGTMQFNCFSIKKLAQIYVSLIESICPNGPYHFFGWSFGGLIALEAAKILSAKKGVKIKNLFLIDPLFNLKEVIGKINSSGSEIQDISFRYTPSFSNQTFCQNIFLFKATKLMSKKFPFPPNSGLSTKIQREIYRYYVNNEKYNKMDAFFSHEQIQLVPLHQHHFSVFEDRRELKKMAAVINQTIYS